MEHKRTPRTSGAFRQSTCRRDINEVRTICEQELKSDDEHWKLEMSSHEIQAFGSNARSALAHLQSEKLEEMWQYKEYVMEQAAHDGSNEYERHRKRARAE